MLFVVLLAVLAVALGVSEYRERRNWSKFSDSILGELADLSRLFEERLREAQKLNTEMSELIAENERKLKA